MNNAKRERLASERIRKLESDLEAIQQKLEQAQTKNGQEDKRISELIVTLETLKENYLAKIKELEAIRDEYEQANNDLRTFRDVMVSNFSRKDFKQ